MYYMYVGMYQNAIILAIQSLKVQFGLLIIDGGKSPYLVL